MLTHKQIKKRREDLIQAQFYGDGGTKDERVNFELALCDMALLSLTQGAEAVRWKIERDEARAALADACDELSKRGAPGFAAVMRKAGGL